VPDPDNDGDGILDGDDACQKSVAEDIDGFEDKDGCPEDDTMPSPSFVGSGQPSLP